MIRSLIIAIAYLFLPAMMPAQSALPSAFHGTTIHSPAGADIYVRHAGQGPVVVLIHGYAETSDSWAPLASDLMRDHTVVVPDLRGIGRSSKPASGYDKKTEAQDIRAVIVGLGYDKTTIVAHDIGNMVAYAYAAMYPDKVQTLTVMDAPIPGIPPWEEIIKSPGVWHFNFHGPDAERLVEGRERIYFDRIWNDFTGDPSQPDEATRVAFASAYAVPGGMRAGFAQFTAFSQDAKDNQEFSKVKLTMPVLAIGGEKSFGPIQAENMRHLAVNVHGEVVPGAGHWLMEEKPAYTVALIRSFIDSDESRGTGMASVEREIRLRPSEYAFSSSSGPGTGTSGVHGIQTIVLNGDPAAAGLYTILLRVPAHTRIAPHFHQDNRSATVISGDWAIGYGERFDPAALKTLTVGSFYTEPGGAAHFARTGSSAVVVAITGIGPSSTTYVNPADAPR
jgi:pimeloyl-ACP methyl ester carboxylesterase